VLETPVKARSCRAHRPGPRHCRLAGGRGNEAAGRPASIAPAARFRWSLLGSSRFILGVRHRGRARRASADEGRDNHEQPSQSSHDRCLLPRQKPVSFWDWFAGASRLHPRIALGSGSMCSRHVTWCALTCKWAVL